LFQGVLRQVPLVGSLVNWWSPPPKEVTTTKGRAFNLTSGVKQNFSLALLYDFDEMGTSYLAGFLGLFWRGRSCVLCGQLIHSLIPV